MLSIVIPVFNEEESLEQLHAQISAVGKQHGYALDIVFIDDGSTDHSWQKIEQLAQHTDTRGIRFRRNFGKAGGAKRRFRGCSRKICDDDGRRPPGRPGRNPEIPGRH